MEAIKNPPLLLRFSIMISVFLWDLFSRIFWWLFPWRWWTNYWLGKQWAWTIWPSPVSSLGWDRDRGSFRVATFAWCLLITRPSYCSFLYDVDPSLFSSISRPSLEDDSTDEWDCRNYVRLWLLNLPFFLWFLCISYDLLFALKWEEVIFSKKWKICF